MSCGAYMEKDYIIAYGQNFTRGLEQDIDALMMLYLCNSADDEVIAAQTQRSANRMTRTVSVYFHRIVEHVAFVANAREVRNALFERLRIDNDAFGGEPIEIAWRDVLWIVHVKDYRHSAQPRGDNKVIIPPKLIEVQKVDRMPAQQRALTLDSARTVKDGARRYLVNIGVDDFDVALAKRRDQWSLTRCQKEWCEPPSIEQVDHPQQHHWRSSVEVETGVEVQDAPWHRCSVSRHHSAPVATSRVRRPMSKWSRMVARVSARSPDGMTRNHTPPA